MKEIETGIYVLSGLCELYWIRSVPLPQRESARDGGGCLQACILTQMQPFDLQHEFHSLHCDFSLKIAPWSLGRKALFSQFYNTGQQWHLPSASEFSATVVHRLRLNMQCQHGWFRIHTGKIITTWSASGSISFLVVTSVMKRKSAFCTV